jgi:hypothetical protein
LFTAGKIRCRLGSQASCSSISDHHLFAVLKQKKPAKYDSANQWATRLNETRDWLKHTTPQLGETRGIAEYEAWVMLVRAVSKYYAVFHEEAKNVNRFVEWSKARGLPKFKYPPRPHRQGIE